MNRRRRKSWIRSTLHAIREAERVAREDVVAIFLQASGVSRMGGFPSERLS